MDWQPYMRQALELAHAAVSHGDVPVGAVVVSPDGRVVGAGRNTKERDHNPIAHAEVVAITQACEAAGSWRLEGHTLVVTLEPCIMCAGALLAARIPRLVIGAWDPKAGATGSQWDLVRDARLGSKVEVISGVLEHESAALLTGFFEQRR